MDFKYCNSVITTSTSFFTSEGMDDYNILIGNATAATTIPVSWDKFYKADRKYNYVLRNEQLLIDAMRNMIRKSNFNDLNESLEGEEITEEEYNIQLDNFTDKYAISLNKLANPTDIDNIIELSLRISDNLKELTLSEVSEMFSVKESDLLLSMQPQIPVLL